MGQATNVTIKKVFKGKSGDGQYGPWQAYDVYFEGSDNKYTYFQSGKKPVPTIGQKIAFIKFEASQTQKDGKTYTNRKITEMVLDETPPEKSQEAPQAQNGKAYIDHGKCVISLMEMAGGAACDESTFRILISLFKDGIALMLKEGTEDHSKEDAPSEAGEFDGYDEPPPIDSEDIPF